MGLSSSQARLLNLTARMHQIEYKAARLEAMKLQMANESTRVYEEYLDALDKTKIQRKSLTSDGSATYNDVSSLADLALAGIYMFRVNSNGTYTPCSSTATSVQTNDGTSVTISRDAITNLINSGEFVLSTSASVADADTLTSVSTNTNVQEVTDEVNLKKAEAKYEADMKRIDLKDRKYDTDLAALDTERNAIKQEMDTLKTVAKDNVERTFKLFS